jgi:hypothetical protein
MNKSTKCKAVLEQYNILYEQYKKNISSTKDQKRFKVINIIKNFQMRFFQQFRH